MKQVLRRLIVPAFLFALFIFNNPDIACAEDAKNEKTSFISGRISEFTLPESEYEQLRRGMTRASDSLALDFCINGSEPLDFGDGNWYYVLHEGDPLAADPVFSLSSSAEDARLYVCGGIDDTMLSGKGELRFMVCSGQKCSSYVLRCRSLPQMFLYTESSIEREYVPGHMRFYDNRAELTEHWIDSDMKIHVRGASSWHFDKRSYKLALTMEEGGRTVPRHESLLGLRKDDDWLLYAGYNDPDRVRNVFCAKLWKECSSGGNGMEYKYIELYLNDNYCGLYALGYPLDAKQLRIGKSEFGQTGEYLYKSRIAPQSSETPMLKEGFSIEGGAIRGDGSEWEPLLDYLDWMEKLRAGDIGGIYERVDVESAIDMYLFVNLIQGLDNIDKNYYLSYKKIDGEYKMRFTPWDFDLCWGSRWDARYRNCTWAYAFEPDKHILSGSNPVHYYLESGDQHMLCLVCRRYDELRGGAWSDENINALLDGYERDIFTSGAYRRDLRAWPKSSVKYGTEDLSRFREYVMQRLEYMDEYIRTLSASIEFSTYDTMKHIKLPG